MSWLLVLLVVVDGTIVLREEHQQPSYAECRDSAYTARSCEVSAFCVPALAPETPAEPQTDCERADFTGDGVVGLPDRQRFDAQMGGTCR